MIYYVTSNKKKVLVAQRYLSKEGIEVVGKTLELEEIQSHSGDEIIKRKATQAFGAVNHPIIVSDHFWNIPALRGFPGAYMKYMNEWLTPDDFLNLMKPYSDRTVFLEEYLTYKDAKTEKTFFKKIQGEILHEIRGTNEQASRSIVTLRADKKSIAKCWQEGISPVDNYEIWSEFAKWYKTISST